MLLLVVPLAVLLVAAWYFSTMLLRPDREVHYPETVTSVTDDAVCLARTRWARLPGRWALRWSDGAREVGAVLAISAREVRRELLPPAGPRPPVGARVALDAGMTAADPAALGLAFEAVLVPAPVGDCPAWLVPGTDPTWVLAVHGRGADRREVLRVLPTLSRLGHPVLSLTYRNDVEAPPGPDGYYHLGDTEWTDLAAAVGYARARGARDVVLYGWSMGAAIIGAYLSRGASCACPVRAVVWDSPVVDWAATLRQQARIRRLPPGLAWTAMRLTTARIGIDFSRFDLARRPPSVRPPTLVLHGAGDSMVPVAASRRLARAAERLDWSIRYVEFPAAEHTASWNADPDRYRSIVAQFLTELVSAAGSRPGAARSARH